MKRSLIIFTLLISIFASFAAEAFASDCGSASSAMINTDSSSESDGPESDQSHKHESCLSTHCHFGHCAFVSDLALAFLDTTAWIGFNLKSLHAIQFKNKLLRPPIA